MAGGAQSLRERANGLARVGHPVALGDGRGRRCVFLGERSEPELVEDLEAALARSAPEPQRVRVERHRDVDVNPREHAALPGRFDVRQEGLAVALLRHFRRVSDERLERPVRGDELARALFADARHALDVVDRVAHQREHVHDLFGKDAEFVLDRSRVVPGAFFLRVKHTDAVAHQLEEILVAGDDGDVEARGDSLRGQRTDHVVGFIALRRQDRHAQRLTGGVHHRNLYGELVGHRRAIRLVVRHEIVAEGASGQIERRADVFRLVLVQQLAQHRDEDIDRVGGTALCVAEEAAFRGAHRRMKRAVHLRAAVDEEQTFTCGH
jgi:hypothetical protein